MEAFFCDVEGQLLVNRFMGLIVSYTFNLAAN